MDGRKLPRFWKKDKISILIEGYERGRLPAEIAADLGRSARAVEHKACELGIVRKGWRHAPRQWTPEHLEILHQMWTAGRPQAAIAEKLGSTILGCATQARKHRWKFASNPPVEIKPKVPYSREFWTEERTAFLKENYPRGMHVIAIAKLLGCSKNAVVGKANRLKLKHPNAGLGCNWAFNPSRRRWAA